MKIVILGGGIVGMFTAYILAVSGHKVTVVDKNVDVGAGTSKENGAQLSYSYAAPLADPALVAKIPNFLFDRASPTRFGRWPDLDLVKWLFKFFLNCNSNAFQKNSLRLLQLSYYSKLVLEENLPNLNCFDFSVAGKIVVYSDKSDFENAINATRNDVLSLAEKTVLTAAECYDIEPALKQYPREIAGGVYSPTDAVGDCQKLCQRMAETISRLGRGNEIVLGAEIRELRRYGDSIASVVTTAGDVDGDVFVVCMGAGARAITVAHGFDLPIYPLKGYSITAPISDHLGAPKTSITDFSKKIVAANIGGRLRVAGLLDFDGYDTRVRPSRLGLLRSHATELFGQVGDFDSAEGWVGFRPATPSGIPIIGRSPVKNLYLNVGHGGLGFTLAAGSAQLLADQIVERRTALDPRDWRIG